MRHFKIFSLGLMLLLLLSGFKDQDIQNQDVHFAVIGDTPYKSDDIKNLETVFDSMKALDIPFVVHVGDIMAPDNGECKEALYGRAKKVFDVSPMPLIITIGDNEYLDCKNIDHIKAREIFIEKILGSPSTTQTLYGSDKKINPIQIERQQEVIENASWTHENVDFVMIALPHLPGEVPLSSEEMTSLQAKNISFLKMGFKNAKDKGRSAIVLIMHSNPAECNTIRSPYCKEFDNTLVDQVVKFDRPVLTIHGDNHTENWQEQYLNINNWWMLRPGRIVKKELQFRWPEVIFLEKEKKFVRVRIYPEIKD